HSCIEGVPVKILVSYRRSQKRAPPSFLISGGVFTQLDVFESKLHSCQGMIGARFESYLALHQSAIHADAGDYLELNNSLTGRERVPTAAQPVIPPVYGSPVRSALS